MSKRNNNEVQNNTEEVTSSQAPTAPTSMPGYKAAALRLSTSRPLGAPATDDEILSGLKFASNGATVGIRGVAGILVLDYIPTLGVSKGSTSALNRAMYQEFNVIRAAISGNRPYQPADHMIYRMCVDGMRELYHKVRMIYGVIRGYSPTNLYRPIAMLDAMGIDGQDWINNAADVYQWLLNHRSALKPYPTVPLGRITDRRLGYNSYIFTDGDIDSSQAYVVNQKYFYSYENVDEVKGATLRQLPATFTEFKVMWDAMYTALQNSTDVYIIAADIRRAFGDAVITDLPETPVDHCIEYVKLDVVLTSIMNAFICGDMTAAQVETFKVRDGLDDGLICTPQFTRTVGNFLVEPDLSFGHLGHINMIEAAPAPEAIDMATRFKPYVHVTNVLNSSNTLVSQQIEFRSMGTEVICGARCLGVNSDGTRYSQALATLIISNVDSVWILNNAASTLSQFDWHPPVSIACVESSGDSVNLVRTWGCYEDVQNYIPINEADLYNIHEANILDAFGF